MSSLKAHVCIVGAGVSGLRCAEVLLENGFQVTILEARDRIGGRICQSEKLGYSVDLGPNWIHTSGINHNPISTLATKTHTPLHHWNDKQNIFSSTGTLIPAKKADKLSSLLWQLIEEAFKHSAANGESISETESLADFVRERAVVILREKRECGDADGDEEAEENEVELLMQMAEMWGAYIGDPITKQSLKFAWMEECCGGDDETFVEASYSSILSAIAAPVLANSNALIQLSQTVTFIRTSPRSSSSQNGNNKVTLKTATGLTLNFDEVILTTPLGWLKRNLPAFDPPLPPRLETGIISLSVGHLEKVYITFASAFWLGWDEKKEKGEVFPGYTNWLAPTYAPDTNPDRWGVEMWNLASFEEPNNHPTLIFYLYGSCSVSLISSLYPNPPLTPLTTTEQDAILEAFFKPFISLLPNYNKTDPRCEVKGIVHTAWQKDELAGYGSYVNVQVGATDAKGDVEVLRRGVPERRLWFAGEHTSPFEELGTVGGAWLSGEAVGRRIVDVYSGGNGEEGDKGEGCWSKVDPDEKSN